MLHASNRSVGCYGGRRYQLLLCLASFLGLVAGSAFSAVTDISGYAMAAVDTPLDFLGGILAVLLPFVLTVICVYLLDSRFVISLSFLKSFSLGAVFMAVRSAFGSAGWLVCLFLMNFSFVSYALICWFWLSLLSSRIYHFGKNSCVYLILSFWAVFVDCVILSPPLISVLS